MKSSFLGKILPFGGVILSSYRNLILLRGTTLSPDPPLGNLPFSISLGTITFPVALSFRGVNLTLGEKALFLEEHSLNVPIVDQFMYRDQISDTVTIGLLPNPHKWCQKIVDQFMYRDQVSATVTK